MQRILYISSFIAALILICWSCKDPYVSPYTSPTTGYLVVEGYISGNTPTQFTLTRTIPLPGDAALPAVNGATVQIQASDSSVYPLNGLGGGTYTSTGSLPLDTRLQYRLQIRTADGEQYNSDFVPYKPTPPIDSVNWVQKSDYSIQIYANTHDPANNTHYYLWSYSQVYEYHSAEETDDYYDKDTAPPMVLPRPANSQVYRCWIGSNSTSIIIGSSTKLVQDEIYEQPLKLIPPDDIQTSVLYSILVSQYSLTDKGYNFLTQMQKNSESLGSVFDAQPTGLSSNIHNQASPTEPVIGFVSAGSVQQQRLFIPRSQIFSRYSYSCPIADTLIPPDQKDIDDAFGLGPLTPEYFTMTRKGSGWLSNYSDCLNCILRGGTNVAPSFWPN